MTPLASESTSLQQRILLLPQELQDEILLWIIKFHLQPGKIFLDGDGKRYKDMSEHEGLDLSLLTLNKRWLPTVTKSLYEGNTWVMPSGPVSHVFFRSWNRADLLSLPSVEFRVCKEDGLCLYPPRTSPTAAPSSGSSKTKTTHFGFVRHVDTSLSLFVSVECRECLLETWSFRRMCVENLRLETPVEEEEEDEDERNQLSDEYLGLESPRKTVLGKLCLEGQSAQVITFNEDSKRVLFDEIGKRDD